MSSTEAPGLPPVRRVITGHTPDGKSTVLVDDHASTRPLGSAKFHDLFWEDSFPANNNGFKDTVAEHTGDLVNQTGSVFRVVEIPPGGDSPFHRTVTLDYGILVNGKVTLILDDGQRVALNQGDVFVQRGTIHSWLNETNESARIYYIMLPAEKVKAGDKELDMEFRSSP